MNASESKNSKVITFNKYFDEHFGQTFLASLFNIPNLTIDIRQSYSRKILLNI